MSGKAGPVGAGGRAAGRKNGDVGKAEIPAIVAKPLPETLIGDNANAGPPRVPSPIYCRAEQEGKCIET